MSTDQRFAIIISLLSLVFVVMSAFLALLVKLVRRWTQTEDNLNNLVDDVKELVIDKEKTHSEMLATMREDRDAINKRLRWLEENLWKSGGRSGRSRLQSELSAILLRRLFGQSRPLYICIGK